MTRRNTEKKHSKKRNKCFPAKHQHQKCLPRVFALLNELPHGASLAQASFHVPFALWPLQRGVIPPLQFHLYVFPIPLRHVFLREIQFVVPLHPLWSNLRKGSILSNFTTNISFNNGNFFGQYFLFSLLLTALPFHFG